MKTINDLLKLVDDIYSVSDNRLYDLDDMFYYHLKWLLRFTEARKKGRKEKLCEDLIIAIAWYLSIINRFNIDLKKNLLSRYSFKCPFCLDIPCSCEETEHRTAKKTGRPVSGKPENISDWQKMVGKIYPDEYEFKSLEILHHQDNFYQTFRKFRKSSAQRNFHQVEIASADYFVELLKLCNSLNIDLEKDFFKLFSVGCFICHKTPCECFYSE